MLQGGRVVPVLRLQVLLLPAARLEGEIRAGQAAPADQEAAWWLWERLLNCHPLLWINKKRQKDVTPVCGVLAHVLWPQAEG